MTENLEEKLNQELQELDSLLDSEISNLQNSEKNINNNVATANVLKEKQENKIPSINELNAENYTAKDYISLGRKAYLKGMRTDALQYFQKAAELEPNNLNAVFNIGVIYLDREEYELAMKQFEQALEIKPDDYKSLCNLAGIYYKLGKLREAYDILNRAIAINPNDINSIQNMKLIEKKILKKK